MQRLIFRTAALLLCLLLLLAEIRLRGARSYADLPAAAVKYIRRIEELVEAPVVLLSTSPERDDTISLRDPFAG